MKFASRRACVYGTRGAVATTQPLASEAGLRILQAGGTAADACVACAAALNVTEPCMTGIGGDAFALFYDASTKQVECLMGNGRSPAALTLDAVRAHPEMKGSTHTLPKRSALTVTVPGAAGAWEDAVSRWGKLPLKRVLEPAIELAERGFPLSGLAARLFAEEAETLRAAAQGQPTPFLPGGAAPLEGEIFRNAELAATFRELAAKGARDGFYTGRVAQAIVDAVNERGGVLTLKDLATHERARFVEPARATYRGVDVWETPPPTAGVVALMALEMLSNVEMPPVLSSAAIHAQSEAIRLAFADALQFLSDAGDPTVAAMLDPERLKRRWEAHFGAQRNPAPLPDPSLGSTPNNFFEPGEEEEVGGADTCYFCAVDQWGNACSFIQSNYCGFGTGIVPSACGFSLQNRGHNFILREGHPNCLGPSKYSYHTIMPAMLTDVRGWRSSSMAKTGDLYAALGVMGGFMQPQGHLQTICGLVDYGLDPQEALDLPRFMVHGMSSELGPESIARTRLRVEEGIDDATFLALASDHSQPADRCSGWERAELGRGQIIKRNPNGVLQGGTEPRADGAVLVW